MKIALAMTVKNEQRLLRDNLRYHHLLGVERAYIYLDAGDRGSDTTVADLDFVHVRPTIHPSSYAGHPTLGRAVTVHADVCTARQTLNYQHAAESAQRDGFSWLICLDADELLHLKPQRHPRGALRRSIAAVPRYVDQLNFAPLEVVQRRVEYENVLREESLFRRLTLRARAIYDPFLHHVHRHRGLLGHLQGKCAVRLGRGLVPVGVHGFLHLDGSRPNTRRLGHLLHYNYFDFPDFLKKTRNFGTQEREYLCGAPVEWIPKKLWRDMASCGRFDDEFLRDYFRRWIMVSDEEIARLRRPRLLGRAELVQVTQVADALSQLSEDATRITNAGERTQ